MTRRKLKRGQVYTSHDGSGLYRIIESAQVGPAARTIYDEAGEPAGKVELVYYWTNRGSDLHRCQRSTFIDWITKRKARRTQKYRRRQIMGSP